MDKQAAYLAGHRECGLKVGDWVRIERAAESRENGWGEDWVDNKDAFVGKTYCIGKDRQERGFTMAGELQDWHFPWFVLTKVDPPEAPPVFEVGDEVKIIGYPAGTNRHEEVGKIGPIKYSRKWEGDIEYHVCGWWYVASSLLLISKAKPAPTDAEEILRILDEELSPLMWKKIFLGNLVARLVEYLDRRGK